MKNFLKMLAAAMASMGLGCVLIAYDASDKAVLACTFAGAILMCLFMGVFDGATHKSNTRSIRDAARSMRDAA